MLIQAGAGSKLLPVIFIFLAREAIALTSRFGPFLLKHADKRA